MNKSVITNLLASVLVFIGYGIDHKVLLTVGLFALSGAFTNWLAVHMLFEKVPFLYGSGVIPAKFEEFKTAIKTLIMEQFFTQENINKFMSEQNGQAHHFELSPIIEQIDLGPAFDNLVEVVEQSQFGSMLAMFGGSEALQPMKEPFIAKMKTSIIDMSQTDEFNEMLKSQLVKPEVMGDLQVKVANIIDARLAELTPQMVKEMVQTMIKTHLGWLVVWGGVFGGLFGLVAGLV